MPRKSFCCEALIRRCCTPTHTRSYLCRHGAAYTLSVCDMTDGDASQIVVMVPEISLRSAWLLAAAASNPSTHALFLPHRYARARARTHKGTGKAQEHSYQAQGMTGGSRFSND